MGHVRVLVVDGDERIRRRLGPWASEGAGAEVALVDVHLAAYGGIRPRVPFAVTAAGYDEVPQRVADAFGALGVVAKDASAAQLRIAVRRLARGVEVRVAPRRPAPVRFTPLDREILRLAALGHTNPEIGARVHLSRDTVKQHTCSIYRKLGARNRAQAAVRIPRMGMPPDPARARA